VPKKRERFAQIFKQAERSAFKNNYILAEERLTICGTVIIEPMPLIRYACQL
jgi:hypothetical protein